MHADASRLAALITREKNRFIGYVRRRLSRISSMDAEDIVSDVILGIVRRADVFGEVENLTAYAYRSLENRIVDHLRGGRDTIPLDEEGLPDQDHGLVPRDRDTPEQAASRLELRERLRQAVDSLSPGERHVWIATEIDGRSFKELAAESGEPIGTLLSRKSRANARLREMLKDYHSF